MPGLSRRSFLAVAASAAAQNTRPPNIVFILTDDLGWGDLSCYGSRFRTPRLDQLAREGTQFTQFYVNGPVCSPSRTAFFTGRFPNRLRVSGHFATEELNAKRGMPNFLDPSVPNVPRALKQAGYVSGQFGKWHLGFHTGAPMPDAYGIDEHLTVASNEKRWEEQRPGFRAQSTRMIVDEGIRFMERNRDKPFYLALWTLLPHATLDPTEAQLAKVPNYGAARAPKYKTTAQVYYASLLDLDEQIGRLMDKLGELGLRENTIVLFSSDNGPEDIHLAEASHSGIGSPGPFRGRKRSLYEGGVRVPFLASWPGRIPAGRVDTTSVVSAVDFMPTLTRIAGVEPPDAKMLDGEDIRQALFGKPWKRTRPLMWEWRYRIAGYATNHSPMLSIRDGNWKLLFNPDRSRVELYDVVRDSMEVNNVAAQNADVVKRLSEMALVWQKTLPPGPIDPGAGQVNYPWPTAKP
jgi:N-acetylgalactosamine-6-sulfatase